MSHPLSADSHAAPGLPRSRAVKPGQTIEGLFGTRRRETRSSAADSIYSATYAICAREVAAVRIGVGRGARHEIILRSGIRLPVTYAQATHLADKIWDGVWPGERSSSRKSTSNKGKGNSKGKGSNITKKGLQS